MNRFEDELRIALRSEEPPAGFADRILERIAKENFQVSAPLPPRRVWQWRFPMVFATAAACLFFILATTVIWIRQQSNNTNQTAQTIVESNSNDILPTVETPDFTTEVKDKPKEIVRLSSPPVKRIMKSKKVSSIPQRTLRKFAVAKPDAVILAKNNELEMRERNKKDLIAVLFVVSDELKKIKVEF